MAATGAGAFSGASLAAPGDLEGLAAVIVNPPKPPNPKREAAAVAKLANEELRFDEDRVDDMMELTAVFGGDEVEPVLPTVRVEMDVGSAAIVADDEDVEMGANAFLVISGEAFTLAVVDSATRGSSFPFPLNEPRDQFPRSFGTDCETVAG